MKGCCRIHFYSLRNGWAMYTGCCSSMWYRAWYQQARQQVDSHAQETGKLGEVGTDMCLLDQLQWYSWLAAWAKIGLSVAHPTRGWQVRQPKINFRRYTRFWPSNCPTPGNPIGRSDITCELKSTLETNSSFCFLLGFVFLRHGFSL